MAGVGRSRLLAIGAIATVLLAAAAFVRWHQPSPKPSFQDRAAVPFPAARPGFQHGVNFTAEWPGGYGGPQAEAMLRKLPAEGVDAIALVPYAFTPPHSTIVRMGGHLESEQGMLHLASVAHSLGMKVLLKPQVWMRDGYPGDLQFSSPSRERAWFRQYRQYLLHEAALAVRLHADIFCVGVEFSHLSRNEAAWRHLIAEVRTIYHGPLVYAANPGDEFEHLRFWDALDYIGLDEYYPLPDSLDTTTLVRRVQRVYERYHKPVLLTEVGFPSLRGANRQPWEDASGEDSPAALDLQLQARAYAAIFAAFYPQPWCAGMYWWKIGTNGFGGPDDGSHTPWGKPAMQVMAQWYRQSAHASARTK